MGCSNFNQGLSTGSLAGPEESVPGHTFGRVLKASQGFREVLNWFLQMLGMDRGGERDVTAAVFARNRRDA